MKEKDFLSILREKFNIESLNPMQRRMLDECSARKELILLSPTGSGKTIAFTLPLLKWLKAPTSRIQAVIIAPSRELVQQIFSVVNLLAAEYKVTALYGGHKVEDEINSLSAGVDIVVATPGRLLDHIQRRNIDPRPARIVILDEFDKSLELGFEKEMEKILAKLKDAGRFILTSATRADSLPDFLHLENPLELNFLNDGKKLRNRMRIRRVDSDSNDKLETLLNLLMAISKGKSPDRTIIFVNHRESAERVASFLRKNSVDFSLYHGKLDQRERETALALFNNGSCPILVATDLAARGLDIQGVENIIHYHQPTTQETYAHRNGRTARVDASGDIYMLVGPNEEVNPFVKFDSSFPLSSESSVANRSLRSGITTLYISDGKKEKLSKGDILGFLIKTCGLDNSDVGKIFIFDHYSLVAVSSSVATAVVKKAQTEKIKGKKRKLTIVR